MLHRDGTRVSGRRHPATEQQHTALQGAWHSAHEARRALGLALRRRRSSSGWYGTKGSAAAGDARRTPRAGSPLLARSPSASSQVSSTRSCAEQPLSAGRRLNACGPKRLWCKPLRRWPRSPARNMRLSCCARKPLVADHQPNSLLYKVLACMSISMEHGTESTATDLAGEQARHHGPRRPHEQVVQPQAPEQPVRPR